MTLKDFYKTVHKIKPFPSIHYERFLCRLIHSVRMIFIIL